MGERVCYIVGAGAFYEAGFAPRARVFRHRADPPHPAAQVHWGKALVKRPFAFPGKIVYNGVPEEVVP